MPRMTLNGAILMWHMGSTEKQVPALKLLQACHFSHLKHGVERVAMMKDTWTNNGWDEATLMAMHQAQQKGNKKGAAVEQWWEGAASDIQ
eukprot:116151-Ditylum_brightwellii.AAC.1